VPEKMITIKAGTLVLTLLKEALSDALVIWRGKAHGH